MDLDRTDKLRAMQFLASELVKEESATDSTAAALAFYKAELRPILEPNHNGENVAIHVDTKDYEVAKGPGHAHRGLRARHPEGFVIVHQIGPANSGLVARMQGETPR